MHIAFGMQNRRAPSTKGAASYSTKVKTDETLSFLTG
jgi:hypothetical protein